MPNNLTLEQVQRLKEYKSLLPKEKKFIDAFVTNGGDPIASTSSAYECKDERSAKAFSYQVMARPRILSVLYLFHNEDATSVEIFLNHLWKLIQKGQISQEQIRAMVLYAQVQKWIKEKQNLPAPKATAPGPDSNPAPEKSPADSALDDVISLFEE